MTGNNVNHLTTQCPTVSVVAIVTRKVVSNIDTGQGPNNVAGAYPGSNQ